MIKRILTALVMVVVVFGFILGLRQVHPAILAGFVGVLSLAATYEMCDALKKAEKALAAVRAAEHGKDAVIIGRFREGRGVSMITRLGGRRVVRRRQLRADDALLHLLDIWRRCAAPGRNVLARRLDAPRGRRDLAA